MRKLKPLCFVAPLVLSSALWGLTACTPSAFNPPFLGVETEESTHMITPRTKGSTLEITPRTKGTTYLNGVIALSQAFAEGGFEVLLRQNDLPLNTSPILTDLQGNFRVPALSLIHNMPLYIEVRSLTQPQVMLMHEVMVTEQVPAELPVEISVDTTAAVYTSRYLNVPSQSPEVLLASPELLAPVKAMLETHFMSSEDSGNMMDMPTMNASLEKARAMWMLHNQETTP